LPENATGLHIEGGEQGARAVPDVLELAAAGAARSRSAARMLALESLHAGFSSMHTTWAPSGGCV